MNSKKQSDQASLIERAGALYDLQSALNGRAAPALKIVENQDTALDTDPARIVRDAQALHPADRLASALNAAATRQPVSAARRQPAGTTLQPVDRAGLEAAGYGLPGAAASVTGEEFRIVKRKLLAAGLDPATSSAGHPPFVLVTSAHPGDGKSWCALNLALSLAAEQDLSVCLVDADTAKPSLSRTLGLPDGPGLIDALSDPMQSVEDLIIATDIAGLSFLPAGSHTTQDTELLASARTRRVFDAMRAADPARILVLDSPPLLAASSAAVIGSHVGQVVMVVRADCTSESSLRDAISQLPDGPEVHLLLNGVQFSASGRQYGHYYRRSGGAE